MLKANQLLFCVKFGYYSRYSLISTIVFVWVFLIFSSESVAEQIKKSNFISNPKMFREYVFHEQSYVHAIVKTKSPVHAYFYRTPGRGTPVPGMEATIPQIEKVTNTRILDVSKKPVLIQISQSALYFLIVNDTEKEPLELFSPIIRRSYLGRDDWVERFKKEISVDANCLIRSVSNTENVMFTVSVINSMASQSEISTCVASTLLCQFGLVGICRNRLKEEKKLLRNRIMLKQHELEILRFLYQPEIYAGMEQSAAMQIVDRYYKGNAN